jgi:hypothetical protein
MRCAKALKSIEVAAERGQCEEEFSVSRRSGNSSCCAHRVRHDHIRRKQREAISFGRM